MENSTLISMNVDIAAQKIISQIAINNMTIEEELKRSIEKAIADIFEVPEVFDAMIKESIQRSLVSTVNSIILSYDLKQRISQSITNIVEDKLSDYAEEIGKKIESAIAPELVK